jgi:hypothetical protein
VPDALSQRRAPETCESHYLDLSLFLHKPIK